MSRNQNGEEPQIRASKRLIQVAEWELQQVLLDIHDGPVQHMYAALSQLDLLRRALAAGSEGTGPEVTARLDRVRALLEEGLTDVRTCIGAYRTPKFETSDVSTLLEGLALQHEAVTDTRVVLDTAEWDRPTPLPAKIVLYRVLQESLSNAYRHGGASQVLVKLEPAGDAGAPALRLLVQDNGAGFDRTRLPGGRHFGLEGMEDRVAMVGGSFKLQSVPGQGTRILAEVPL